ncbi:hypothetical protein MTR67_043259 [Solanum verrucosum]|uniref:Thionin-like protein n=1 Tax=Solanum verrucosum TaxID=315347 RepID=A0AAF0URE7_SOLVR|nr:hypothetical protein MTR67_043259 [Solanum verrucosum]
MLLLFLAMFMLTKHNAMAQNIDPKCAAFCVLRCQKRPICPSLCLVKCAITTITYESVDTEAANRVCNVGCSLGHIFKFLINYGTFSSY